MTEPSVVANSRLSFTENTLLDTKRTPSTLNAASLARNRRSAFSSTGTSNGSMSCGVIHRPLGYASTGASSVCWGAMLLLAVATAVASRATLDAASRVTSRVPENPHEPPTRARTPMPYDSV